MKHRRAWMAALVALPLAMAPAAHADESVAPPFSRTDRWSYCSTSNSVALISVPAGGTCSEDAQATGAGLMSTALSIETGPLPTSSGYASANAYVGKYVWVENASIVSYTVTYRVTGASAATQNDPPLPTSLAYAETWFSGSVTALDSDAGDGFGRSLASEWGPEVADGVYTARLLLATEDGAAMTGPVAIEFGVSSDIWFDDAPSSTGATGATVEILSVTSRIIE